MIYGYTSRGGRGYHDWWISRSPYDNRDKEGECVDCFYFRGLLLGRAGNRGNDDFFPPEQAGIERKGTWAEKRD